jgi:hypothetical protein
MNTRNYICIHNVFGICKNYLFIHNGQGCNPTKPKQIVVFNLENEDENFEVFKLKRFVDPQN